MHQLLHDLAVDMLTGFGRDGAYGRGSYWHCNVTLNDNHAAYGTSPPPPQSAVKISQAIVVVHGRD